MYIYVPETWLIHDDLIQIHRCLWVTKPLQILHPRKAVWNLLLSYTISGKLHHQCNQNWATEGIKPLHSKEVSIAAIMPLLPRDQLYKLGLTSAYLQNSISESHKNLLNDNSHSTTLPWNHNWCQSWNPGRHTSKRGTITISKILYL